MLKSFQRKIFSLFGTEFSKNIFKVFSGSSIAYFIGFISLPFLTRIYSTDDFGNYQLLFSVILLFSSISSLKYEIAIVLPKYEEEADRVTALSFLSILFTTVLFGTILFTASETILTLLNAVVLKDYIPYLIFGIFFNGIYLALQYVFIRYKEYGTLSKNRILETSVNVVLSIFLGILNFNFAGLFYSKIISLGSASSIIIFRQRLIRLLKLKFSELKTTAKKYSKFPAINTPTVLINSLSMELPVFMMSSFFSLEVVGLFALSRRVLNLPLSLIGKSFSQVYIQSAAEAYHKGSLELMSVYKSTVKKLALIGILPVIVSVFAPYFFEIVFGSEWREAGVYLQLMTFWLYFQFINSPISMTFSIVNKQELALILNSVSLVLRFIVLMIFNSSPFEMILALSIVTAIFYICFNVIIYYTIKRLH